MLFITSTDKEVFVIGFLILDVPIICFIITYDLVDSYVVHMGNNTNVMLLELVLLKSRPITVLSGLYQMFTMFLI